MPIYKESTKIGVIKREARILKKAYHGSTLVFGKEVFRKVFTSSGNITFPTTIISLKVIVVGGGAGGSAGNYDNDWINSTGSGAAGGCAEKIYSNDELSSLKGTNVSFTVGVGGAAGVYKSGIGGVGGKTSFMSIITATGGNPTSGYSNWGTPGPLGQGGVGSGGVVNKQGNPGQYGKVASPGWVPTGGVGWNINGIVYGSGGNGGAASNNGNTGHNGCVSLEYTH